MYIYIYVVCVETSMNSKSQWSIDFFTCTKYNWTNTDINN